MKLLCDGVIQYYDLDHLMNWVSLGVIFVVMLAGILASVWVNRTAEPIVEVKKDKQE